MTREQLQQSGFVFLYHEKKIEPITYREYLNEYGQDLCTSPRGVCDRMHIREIIEGECTKEWQIWSWGTGGNHPYFTGESFDSEEAAEMYCYDRSEWYVQEHNWDAPRWCSTYDEAVEEMANSLGKSETVIRRYLSMSHQLNA